MKSALSALYRPCWLLLGFVVLGVGMVRAQELEPGAYSPAPTGMNIVVVADTYNTGDLSFDPSVPITDASARINLAAFGYLRTFGVAGRQASLGLGLPYARGHLEGLVSGVPTTAYRSGTGDPRLRFAINFYGSPARTPKEYMAQPPEKLIFGASLVMSMPLGQYDPTKVINIGQNRWAFKPELGLSRTFGHWTVELDAGAWLYLDNTNFYGGHTRHQEPLGSGQWHIIYTFRPRMWLALDANYFSGGRTSVDGVQKNDLQRNSRIGLTYSLPLNKQHSLKASWSRGAITNIGADFDSFGLAWQYIWR
jgi:hypothetical protein